MTELRFSQGAHMSNKVKLFVEGPLACFTRPEMKVDRISYDVMTPSAARGILESVHWVPAIRWIVEEIQVLNPIRFEVLEQPTSNDQFDSPSVIAMDEVRRGDRQNPGRRQRRLSTVLADVAYIISARFVMTPKAGSQDSPARHFEIFRRRARKGQCFQQPCFGTRDFPANFRLLEAADEAPAPISETSDLGFMLYDIDYTSGRSSLFFRARLESGILHVPPPDSRELCA